MSTESKKERVPTPLSNVYVVLCVLTILYYIIYYTVLLNMVSLILEVRVPFG